jgi:hypothetical protein
MKAVLGTTVITLIESQPTQDTIKTGQYRYYRFFDFIGTQDIFIDLSPSEGDADLFISCYLKATGSFLPACRYSCLLFLSVVSSLHVFSSLPVFSFLFSFPLS